MPEAVEIEEVNLNINDIADESESIFRPKKKIAHDDVLQEILDALEIIDFRAKAKLTESDKLTQKHLHVMCVDELLGKVKANNFDLARKNDFVFVFNGEYWKELDREMIKNFLGQVAEKFSINSLEAKHYKFKDELYSQFIASTYFKPIEPSVNAVLINLQNGTFEASPSGYKLREFRAGDFLTYQLPFEYDEAATCPIFDAFLDQMLPEKELQDLLAEYFGYVFTKGLKMEKALLLYGTGANGKSVVFDIMNALLGRENISNFSLTNLSEEHNRALIAHKLLNYGSEINATKTRDEFKNLVSTEPIQARLKYGNSFLMENYAKLCFNANELPRDIEQTPAYFRRLLIIPFRATVPEKSQDKTLARKIIEKELPGVFNWILRGLSRLLAAQKFTESEIVKEILEVYKRESNTVAMFLDENSYLPGTDLNSDSFELMKEMYSRYRLFCNDDGYKSLNKRNFKKQLEILKFPMKQTYDGNRVYYRKVQQ